MKQELKIVTSSNYDSVRLIGNIVNKILQELNLNEKEVYSSELAVVEACNNVIEHAHKDKPEEELVLKFIIEEEKVEIQILDKGSGVEKLFNNVKSLKQIDPYSESSRGIPIIKSVMDEVYYKQYKNKNVLRLIKYRKKENLDIEK